MEDEFSDELNEYVIISRNKDPIDNPRPYVVSWTDTKGEIRAPRFSDVTSAQLFATALRLHGYLTQVTYTPEGKENEAILVPEVPL